jgi:hypothetical protein
MSQKRYPTGRREWVSRRAIKIWLNLSEIESIVRKRASGWPEMGAEVAQGDLALLLVGLFVCAYSSLAGAAKAQAGLPSPLEASKACSTSAQAPACLRATSRRRVLEDVALAQAAPSQPPAPTPPASAPAASKPAQRQAPPPPPPPPPRPPGSHPRTPQTPIERPQEAIDAGEEGSPQVGGAVPGGETDSIEQFDKGTPTRPPDGDVPDGDVPDGGVPDGGVPDGGVPDGGVSEPLAGAPTPPSADSGGDVERKHPVGGPVAGPTGFDLSRSWPLLIVALMVVVATFLAIRARLSKPPTPAGFVVEAHRVQGTATLLSHGDLVRGEVRLVGHRNLGALEVGLSFEPHAGVNDE